MRDYVRNELVRQHISAAPLYSSKCSFLWPLITNNVTKAYQSIVCRIGAAPLFRLVNILQTVYKELQLEPFPLALASYLNDLFIHNYFVSGFPLISSCQLVNNDI